MDDRVQFLMQLHFRNCSIHDHLQNYVYLLKLSLQFIFFNKHHINGICYCFFSIYGCIKFSIFPILHSYVMIII